MDKKPTIFFKIPRDKDGRPIFTMGVAGNIAAELQRVVSDYTVVVSPFDTVEINKGYKFCPYCGKELSDDNYIEHTMEKERDMLHLDDE